jgi:hypothetical protein
MVRRTAQWRLLWAVGITLLLAGMSAGLLAAAPKAKTKPKTVAKAKAKPKTAAKAPAKAKRSKASAKARTRRTIAPAKVRSHPVAVPVRVTDTSSQDTGGVEIVAPASESKIRGVTTVRVAWSDRTGYVLFRVDDKFLYSSIAPYQMAWDTSDLEDGSHVLSVDAFDNQGKYQGSSSLQLNVVNTIATPASGVLLSVRFGSEDRLTRQIAARGELARLNSGEVLPAGYNALSGSLQGKLTQFVVEPFYQGTSVLLRNRLKEGWQTIGNVRTSLASVGQYAMVQVPRSGLVVPQLTALRRTRLSFGEISLALKDYPMFVGDTWDSPIGAIPDLMTKQTVYVQAQHTFEGLRWYGGTECAMITSNYTLPEISLYDIARDATARTQTRPGGQTQTRSRMQQGQALPSQFSVALTQMRGGMGGGGMRGGMGGGMGGMGGGMRGGQAGQQGAGARQGGQAAGATRQATGPGVLQTAKLVDLQGTRTTYLARRDGRVVHTEDTIRGRVEFRSSQTASLPLSRFSVGLTQMRGGMGGGGMRGGMGGGMGGGMRGGTGGQQGGRQGGQQGRQGGTRAGAGGTVTAAPVVTRYPTSVDYGFRLTTSDVRDK